MEEFNYILEQILNNENDNELLIKELFDNYYNNKLKIKFDFLANKNNIIEIDDNELNLYKTFIISDKMYKEIVNEYCNFIEIFFSSNEKINEKNIKKNIIDIIYYLTIKNNIINYIINIPEHNDFFYKNGLYLYDENLILNSCKKRTSKHIYKILIKNLVYYKIKIN